MSSLADLAIQTATDATESEVDLVDLVVPILIGLAAFWVLLKLLRLAIRVAFLGAIVAGGIAAYLFIVPDL